MIQTIKNVLSNRPRDEEMAVPKPWKLSIGVTVCRRRRRNQWFNWLVCLAIQYRYLEMSLCRKLLNYTSQVSRKAWDTNAARLEGFLTCVYMHQGQCQHHSHMESLPTL